MILRGSISAQKLRGGYYTPDDLAQVAVSSALRKAKRPVRKVLEPSVGDGGFLPAISQRVECASITIVDVNAEELSKAAAYANDAFASTATHNESFLQLADEFRDQFDAAFGNPPFVRFQFVSESDKKCARHILGDAEIDGVSNLWIPLMVGALRSLRPGGVFGFVIPQEFLSTKSAKAFRDVLVREFDDIEMLFPLRGAFSEILQDVVIISGRRSGVHRDACSVSFVTQLTWTATVSLGQRSWLPYLLEDDQREAYSVACALSSTRELRSLAKFSVSTVTGANEFFCVSHETRREYELELYTVPLLAKGSDTQGLLVSQDDVANSVANGRPAWLFRTDVPFSELSSGAQRYVRYGESLELHKRYKCAIRFPWYNVPVVSPKGLLMSKRSHRHPRVAVNASRVTTTDTIYQGVAAPRVNERSLAASFHSSLTMLSCELEGRSYGGGVLELIPSEIERVQVITALQEQDLAKLDEVSRLSGGQLDTTDALVSSTDALLREACTEYAEVLPAINAGWNRLKGFRHRGIGSGS